MEAGRSTKQRSIKETKTELVEEGWRKEKKKGRKEGRREGR